METINNLIQQTKEEIEEARIDKANTVSKESHDLCDKEIREGLAKLSALQTAQAIFLKMLDEVPVKVHCKDENDKLIVIQGINYFKEEVKQKLLGEKDG